MIMQAENMVAAIWVQRCLLHWRLPFPSKALVYTLYTPREVLTAGRGVLSESSVSKPLPQNVPYDLNLFSTSICTVCALQRGSRCRGGGRRPRRAHGHQHRRAAGPEEGSGSRWSGSWSARGLQVGAGSWMGYWWQQALELGAHTQLECAAWPSWLAL